MIKKFLSLVVFLTFLISGISCQLKGQLDCSAYKNGTFVFPASAESDTKIVRTGNKQIESSEKHGFIDEYSIEWISDCEYVAVLIKTNRPQDLRLTPHDTLRVKIFETDPEGYNFTFHFMSETKRSRLEFYKPSTK